MGFAETAPLVATLDLKGNFASQLKRNQGALSSFSGSLGKAGRGAGQLGSGFARVGTILGTAVVGGLAAAAKAAINFEDAFAGVRKTVNEADLTKVGLSFDILAKQFRTMATEIPIAATELAQIGETAGALGIRAQDIEKFTKTVALLSVTTDLSADAAAEALGKVGTILGFVGKDYQDFADILVNLGNQGASVESEIIEVTKRFAAQGKQAGLTTAEIAALASVSTSLGAEPEAAGSALSRIFSNMGTEIALASKKGQAFAQITAGVFDDLEKLDEQGGGSHVVGKFDEKAAAEIKRLQESVNKGEALPEFRLFLRELGKLDRLDMAKALKASGITNVLSRNAIINMAENIAEVDRQLNVAKDSIGALDVEAQKRFDTIASKLTLLKNNFIEAGITIGEGFLPALGRATDKLIAFLKVDANKSALKTLGEDIGKTLDGIDWDAVLSGTKQFVAILKDAAGVATGVLKTLNMLPTEIKAAGLGFLALNKLSGGLIGAGAGNLIGGLAETIIKAGGSRLPGPLGAAFAQPVFVTNWAMMAGGGLGGAAGGKFGLLGALFPAAGILAIGYAIGDAIVQATGGAVAGTADAGTGRALGDIAGLKVVIGQNTAALVRAQNARERQEAQFGPPTPRGWENRGAEMFGPPAPPTSGGREARSTFSVDAAILRGIAAGFKPTAKAGEATVQRNLERLAAANLAATDRVKAEAARTTAAAQQTAFAIRDVAAALRNMDRKPPVVNVNINAGNLASRGLGKPPITPAPRRFGFNRPEEFATGAWDIPSDMAAFIHKGEMVVPSRLAEILRRSGTRNNVLSDEEQRQAEETLRKRAERAWLLQASLATRKLGSERSGPMTNTDMFGGRFIPSAKLDPSQIQDRRPPPITNVKVQVNVTAAQVSKSVVVQRRYGPSGGSRDRGGVGGPQEF